MHRLRNRNGLPWLALAIVGAGLMGGCGVLLAQILLSQTIWKKLP